MPIGQFSASDFGDEPETKKRPGVGQFDLSDFGYELKDDDGLRLVDAGARKPGENPYYDSGAEGPKPMTREGARMAPTYVASTTVTATAIDEPLTLTDVPIGMRSDPKVQALYDTPRNKLLKAKKPGKMMGSISPEELQHVAGTVRDEGAVQKALASTPEIVSEGLEVADKSNPAASFIKSGERILSPLRVSSKPTAEEAPNAGDLVNMLTLGLGGAATDGGMQRAINESGVGKAANKYVINDVAGAINEANDLSYRGFLSQRDNEGVAEKVLMTLPRAAGAGADVFTQDPTNLLLAGTGGVAIEGGLGVAKKVADTLFAANMVPQFADSASAVYDAAAEGDTKRALDALPGAIATGILGVSMVGPHAITAAERAVHGASDAYYNQRGESLAKRSFEKYGEALASANEKAKANLDAGRGTYDGMTADEVSAFAHNRKTEATLAGRDVAMRLADPEGKNQVPKETIDAINEQVHDMPLRRGPSDDELAAVARSMFSDRPDVKVQIHEDTSTLPRSDRTVNVDGDVNAAYDGGTNTVHVVRPRVTGADTAVAKLAHEKEHSTSVGEFPAHKVAGMAERLFKQELFKLTQEKALSQEEFARLMSLTGRDFVREVKKANTGPDSPMQIAADEVVAVMREGVPIMPDPSKLDVLVGKAARAIPGVEMTAHDVRSVAGDLARSARGEFTPDRPVENVGQAPDFPQPGDVYAADAQVGPQQPPAPPPPISVGDRVSAVGPKGKPIEGVLEKVSKSGKTAMVKLDDGKSVRVDFDKVARPEPKPAEPAPIAPEAPVAPPVQQPVPEATIPAVDRRTHGEMRGQFEGRRWSDLTDAERVARGYQNELSGLPGKRYWDDAIDTPDGRAQRPDAFFYDLDDFKMLNDRLSHEGVDKMVLPFLGDAIKEVWSRPEFKDSVALAHRSGDEFTGRSPSSEVSDAFVSAVNDRIRNAEFVFEHNGQKYYHKGLGGSHGTGPDIVAAESASKRSKAERRARGERVGYRDSELGLPPAGREAGGDPARREVVPSDAGAGAEVAPLVIRPQGWDAASDAVASLTRPGHLYRGMTEAEFNATVGSGRGISSRQDYSVRGEGTSFSDDAAAAESYVNFGRDDPRKTGRPTYLVEVSAGPDVAFDRRDGYYKATGEIPSDRITRVLRMDARDGAVVASEVRPARAEVAPFPEAEAALPASDGIRLSRSRPNDKLLRPILGDLVELSAQMMADKRNGIESADDLFAALSDGMGASFAERVKKASPFLYEQASAEASQRENLGPTIKQAIEQQLKPKGDQSRPIDATPKEIAEASDYLRETYGLATQQGNKKAIAAGLELYANLGYEGVAQLIHNAADRTKSESILFGKELPPEVVVAAKLALNDPEANARAERDPKSMVDQVALWQAWRTIGSLQSESFRLRSFRENMMPEPERVKARLRELVIGSNASRRAFTEKDAVAQIKKLKAFLKKRLGVEDVDSIPLETLSNKDEMSKLANELSALNANAGMKLRTYLINNLVSQFSTNTANIVGNIGNAGVEYIAYRRLEAALNKLIGHDAGVLPSDLRGLPALIAKAHGDALNDAKSYWRTGYNPTHEKVHGADWVDQLGSQIRSFGGEYTKHIEMPTRALGAEDAYFVSMIGRMEAMSFARGMARQEMVEAQAKAIAKESGLSLNEAKKKVDVKKLLASDEYNDRVFGLYSDMKSEAWIRAMDRAYYLTFKNESSRVLKTLLMIKNRHPNFVWIQSFLTMPINGMLRGAEMVPGVGLVSGGMFSDIGKLRRKEITTDQFKTQITRMAAGQMIGVLGAMALSQLNLTQYGDDGEEPWITGSSLPRGMDTAEAEAQRRSLEPYTVKVPFTDNTRMSYRRFEPIATGLGLTVDGVAAFEDFVKRRNMGRTFTRLKNALYGQIAEKPFLQGINNIADWLRDAPGAPNPLFTYSSMLAPKVITQFPRAFDPYVREGRLYGADATQEGYSQWERLPHSFVQNTMNIPWGIEPKVTLLGDEVRKSGHPLQRLLLGDELRTESRSSTDQQTLDDKYLELAQRAGEDTPNLPREMRGDIQFGERKFKVDPKEWAQMEKDRGVILRDVARQLGLLDDPNRKMTPEDVEILRSVSESSAKMARGKLAPKYMALPQK